MSDASITIHTGYLFVDGEKITMAALRAAFSLAYGTFDSGSIGTTLVADKAMTLAKFADLVRGSILVGQTADDRPTALDAKTATYMLIGDGTDLVSVEITGDATITAAGVVAVANQLTVATQWNADDVNFPEKATLVNDDLVVIEDSEASYAKKKVKRSAFTNLFPGYWKHNLEVKNNAATPNTQIDVDCDELVVETAAGSRQLISSINVTIDTAGTGANGMDSGSLAGTTFYYVWVIYNPTTSTTAGLISTSATNPTMPADYTYKRLVGEVYSDGSTHFVKHNRFDDQVWFEAPSQIYNAHTLTSTYVQHNLPAQCPSACTRLMLECGASTNAAVVRQIISPDNTPRFEVTLVRDLIAADCNHGPTGSYGSIQFDMKHLGATSVYARANESGTRANQNLDLWGYELAR